MVSFTNLPTGAYRFEVTACNSDGIWSEKPAILNFDISPPWYQSAPAYLKVSLGRGRVLLSSCLFANHKKMQVYHRALLMRKNHYLQRQTFDLVLTDVMMPEMDGNELCKEIRQSPKFGYLPIVMLTARNMVSQELEGLSTGADEYVTKPFKPQVLLARLAGLLQARARLKEYYHRQILLEPSEIVIPNAEMEF